MTLRQLASVAQGAEQQSAGGMLCPHCGCRHYNIVRTWWVEGGRKHRTYRCRNCGKHEFNAEVREEVKLL